MTRVFQFCRTRKGSRLAAFRSVYQDETGLLQGDVIANPVTGRVEVRGDSVVVPLRDARAVARYLIRIGWSQAV